MPDLLDHKPDLATLEQIIDTVNRKVPIQIEVKTGENITPIIHPTGTLLLKVGMNRTLSWPPTPTYIATVTCVLTRPCR